MSKDLLHIRHLEKRHRENWKKIKEHQFEIQYLKALDVALQMLDFAHLFIQVYVPLPPNFSATVASENDSVELETTKNISITFKNILFTFEKYHSDLYLSSFTITD